MAVEILESCMVKPGKVTPKHKLWLSILDLVVVRGYTPMVFFYKPSPNPVFFSPDILKAALSKALVPFYPIAGRLVSDSTDCTEIQCTGDGVLFITAQADAILEDMEDATSSDELRRTLVPSADGGDRAGILAMFQVTFFKCGGVCLGTATHNLVADGRAFANFLKTWCTIASGSVGKTVLSPPYLDRTLLRARSPPDGHFNHAEYPRRRRGCVASNPKVPLFDTAVLPISMDQVSALKCAAGAGAGAHGKRVSTFNAVVAHVWRCACEARGLEGTEVTRVYTTVDVRSRIDPPLPAGYLGNATIRTSMAAKVGDVVSSQLAAIADKVAVATARLSDEYIRSLMDYMEQAMSNGDGLLHMGQWAIPDTDLWVVSWMGLNFSDVDFGWGRPAFFGRATIRLSNLVCLVPSPDGDGLNVTISMEPERLSRLKELFYEGLKYYSF